MMIHVKGWFTEYMVERCKVDKVFAESKAMNAVHGSDSDENAAIEAKFHFTDGEIF